MQELWLYGIVEEGGESSTAYVRDALKKFNRREPIKARINSPGGSVTEGVAIRTLLSEWPAGVDVQVDGIAASIASYIATVGRNVVMARDAMLMIHDAWSITVGGPDDHRKTADVLDQVSEVIVTAYAQKSGKTRKEIRAAMRTETWYTAAGAVEFGLADSILGERATEKIAALQARLDAMVLSI